MSTGAKGSVNLLATNGSDLYLQDCNDAGSFTELVTHASRTFVTGDVVMLWLIGNQAYAYHNGVLVLQGTTSRTSGRFGPWVQSGSGTATLFQAGDVVSANPRAAMHHRRMIDGTVNT